MTQEISDLLNSQAKDLLSANAPGIAEELQVAEDGKLSIGATFKLVLIGRRILVNSSVQYSRKFKDESEGMTELSDPLQPELLPKKGK